MNSKTPISLLQEMMTKRKVVPNYELVFDGGGTHDNIFTFRVSCDGLTASGTGRCKKEAKHEAAKAMLELIAARRAYPQLPASSPPPMKKSLLMEVKVSPKRSANTPFLNCIGALTQFCLENNLQQPIYMEVSDVGPPHARIFTYGCIVSTFKEIGVATTKKQAKHEAAKKMLEKLQDVVDIDEVCQEMKDNKNCQSQKTLNNEKITALYLSLTKLPSRKVNLGLKMKEYHNYLKINIDKELLPDILTNLSEFEFHLKENSVIITKEILDGLRKKFIEIIEPMNMFYFSKRLETFTTENCVVLLEIFINPVITGIGIAETEHEAEKKAILKSVQVLITLLS